MRRRLQTGCFFYSSLSKPAEGQPARKSRYAAGCRDGLPRCSPKAPVTLEALQEHFGWLPHTARATVARLRRTGLQIGAIKLDGQARIQAHRNGRATLTIGFLTG